MLANLGGGLTEELAVDAGQDDDVLVDLGRDALRQVEDDRMREAERHVELLAGDLGAITDAVDLELRSQPSETPFTMLASSARSMPCFARFSRESSARSTCASWPLTLTETPVGIARLSSPFGPLTESSVLPTLSATPFGSVMSFLPTRDIGYQISQSSSPPSPAFWAWRSVMMPFDVVRMATPEAGADLRHVVLARVLPLTRTRDATDALDRVVVVGVVPELDGDDALLFVVLVRHAGEEALVDEDLRDALLELRRRESAPSPSAR